MRRMQRVQRQLAPATTSGLQSQALKLAADWVRWDPNPATRAIVQKLLDAQDHKTLAGMMAPRIAFGTAGLRARMAPGFHNINDLVVLQATQGLCAYVLEHAKDAKQRGVVIGHDARYNSKRFAELATAVFLHKGVRVQLFPKIVCTPFVPFAVSYYKAACGLMITASHNPKDDNGYKVYWESGAQIIPPHDAGIARSILDNQQPWNEAYLPDFADSRQVNPRSMTPGGVWSSPLCTDPYDEVYAAYFHIARTRYSFTMSQNRQSPLRVAYTAMHGIGAQFVSQVFESFQLPPYVPVKEQIVPDPDFPTVAFPNPEEGKGALALAMKTADAHGCAVVLASDPDADRLAVAEACSCRRDDTQHSESKSQPQIGGLADSDCAVCSGLGWRIFNGNEIALLFADWVFRQYRNGLGEWAVDVHDEYKKTQRNSRTESKLCAIGRCLKGNRSTKSKDTRKCPHAGKRAHCPAGPRAGSLLRAMSHCPASYSYKVSPSKEPTLEPLSRSAPSKERISKALMLVSTASSRILEAMARAEGFTFVDTLTGFKWMGSTGKAMMDKNGYEMLLAYEVEIGFLVGNQSFDKDGVRTAAIMYELASHLYRQGSSLQARLEELYSKYGYFVMNPSYFFCDSRERLDTVFADIRSTNVTGESKTNTSNKCYNAELNHQYPTTIGEWKVTSVRDLTSCWDSLYLDSGGKAVLPSVGDNHMITFRLSHEKQGVATVTIRNSGTEPKIKYYVECSDKKSGSRAKEATDALEKAVVTELLKPQKFGLTARKSS